MIEDLLNANLEIIPQKPGQHCSFLGEAERKAGFGADAVLISHTSKHLDIVRTLLSHGARNEPGSDYEVGLRLLDAGDLGQFQSWIDARAANAPENRPEIVEFIKHVWKRVEAMIEENKR